MNPASLTQKKSVPEHRVSVRCFPPNQNFTRYFALGRPWGTDTEEVNLTDSEIAALEKEVVRLKVKGPDDNVKVNNRPVFAVSVIEKNVGQREIVVPIAPVSPNGSLDTELRLQRIEALARDSALRSIKAEGEREAMEKSLLDASSENESLRNEMAKLKALLEANGVAAQATAKVEEERLPSIPTAEELAAPAPAKSKGK